MQHELAMMFRTEGWLLGATGVSFVAMAALMLAVGSWIVGAYSFLAALGFLAAWGYWYIRTHHPKMIERSP